MSVPRWVQLTFSVSGICMRSCLEIPLKGEVFCCPGDWLMRAWERLSLCTQRLRTHAERQVQVC